MTPQSGGWLFLLDTSNRSIRVPRTFKPDQNWYQWLESIPNLDERDYTARVDQLAQSLGLHAGAAVEEALNKARRTSKLADGAALLLFAGVLLPWGVVLLSAKVWTLLLAPWVVMALVRSSKGLLRLFPRVLDPRAALLLPIVIGPTVLTLFALAQVQGRLVAFSSQILWPVVAFLIVFVVGAFRTEKPMGLPVDSVLGILFFGVLYGFGAALALNQQLDRSPGEWHQTSVVAKSNKGRPALELAPWGPVTQREQVPVSAGVHARAQAGDTVVIQLHPGAFGAAWYVVDWNHR